MNAARSSRHLLAIVVGALLIPAAAAQAQHGGGHGSGHHGGGHYATGGHYAGGGHYRGGYYGGHRYYPRFSLYGYFGYPYYGYGYGYGYPYWYGGYGGYGERYDTDTGAVRLQVEPNDTRVFADGYYAGIVDDFDGGSGLRLPPGRHEIALKLEGHSTHRIAVYVAAGQTLRIRYRMAAGAGDDSEDLTPERYSEDTRGAHDEHPLGAARRAPDGRGEPNAGGAQGEVRLSVWPGDAVVYVDGEFRGPGNDLRALLLPLGQHSIEVVRPGFQRFERSVDVKLDQRLDVDVELQRAGS